MQRFDGFDFGLKKMSNFLNYEKKSNPDMSSKSFYTFYTFNFPMYKLKLNQDIQKTKFLTFYIYSISVCICITFKGNENSLFSPVFELWKYADVINV